MFRDSRITEHAPNLRPGALPDRQTGSHFGGKARSGTGRGAAFAGGDPNAHLRDPRRLPGRRPGPGRLVGPGGQDRGSRRPDVPRDAGRRRRGDRGLRDRGDHARAHALPGRALRPPAEAQAPRHDRYAQRFGRPRRRAGPRRRRLRHREPSRAAGRAGLGADPRPRPPPGPGGGGPPARRSVAEHGRHRPRRTPPRAHRPRQDGRPDGADRAGLRDGGRRLEPEPHRRAGGRRRGGARPDPRRTPGGKTTSSRSISF